MSKNKRRQIGTVTAQDGSKHPIVSTGEGRGGALFPRQDGPVEVRVSVCQAERDERAGLIPSAYEGGDPMGPDFGGSEGSGAGYSATFLSGSVAHLDSGGAYAGEMGQLSRERQAFVDQAAIARFGAGYPAAGCYREATKLWDERAKWLREQERKR